MAAYVLPVIGALPVAEVGTELVVKVHADIWQAKAGREHRVPLAPSVRVLVRNMPCSSDFVSPVRQSGTQLSDMSLKAVLRRIGHGDITSHEFCSTFRDWCAEAISNTFSREVCERALAHSLPDRVEAAYRHGDLFEKCILPMRTWADFCDALTKQGETL